MPANSNLLPVPSDREKDEKALAIAALATRIWAGLLGAYIVMMVISAAALVLPASGPAFFSVLAYFVMFIPAIAIFAWLNLKSAKAMMERRDAQFSCLVAGMNMMVFPLGTMVGLYSWQVLARNSVKDLYDADVPRLSKEPRKSGHKPTAAQPKPEIAWHDASIEIDESEEKLWKEIEAKATGQHNLTPTADGGNAKTPSSEETAPSSAKPQGSVRLVATDE